MKAAAGPPFTYGGAELGALAEAKNYYGWIVERFARHLGERIVEVGAGIGTFTEYLMRYAPGSTVTAIEPAADNFARLARRLAHEPRLHPVHGYLDSSFPESTADSVVAVNVM